MNKNIAIIGDVKTDLGKKGNTVDIQYFSKNYLGDIYSIFLPIKYPEKVQSLLVAINLADFVILKIDKIDWMLGEEIVACELLGKKGIIFTEEWIYSEVKRFIEGTSLSKWPLVKSDEEMWEYLREWKPKERDGKEIWIDQSFKVKSVGTVVLGVLKAGSISVHDRYKIFPAEKEIEIKSIQMQDKDQKNACCNARVGLSLKGIEPEEIPRGSIIGDSKLVESIESWEKLKFYKGDEKKITHIFHGISFVGYQNGKIVKAIPKSKTNNRFLLIENTDKEHLRIAGYGEF